MALRPSTKLDFQALWRSVLPASYTEPIEQEAEGAGFDIPALQAAIWEGFENDLNLSQQAYFLRRHSIATGPTAAGGAKARTTLELYRAAPAIGDVLIPQGRPFQATATDSFGGELLLGRFFAVEEVTIPEGETGPFEVEVEAEFEGYAGNVWEGCITAFEPQGRLTVPALITEVNEARRTAIGATSDRFNMGMVGRMVRIVPLAPLATPDANAPRRVVGTYLASGETVIRFEPPLLAADVMQAVQIEVEELEDLGVTVTQPEPATGGRADALAAIAGERKTERQLNETDEEMADRLAQLPDTVSPGAIERAVARVLDPYGIPWCFHETLEVDQLMGFTWDVHPWDVGSPCACTSDEPPGSELIGSGIVWLSDAMQTRFFVICVTPTLVENFGAAWDSTVQDGDWPNAWDLFVWDGYDLGFGQVMGRLRRELDGIRMAGVAFAIVLDEGP